MNAPQAQELLRRNVRVLMAARGIETVRELARIMGRNEGQLARQINGTRSWQVDDMSALANALGVTLPDLLNTVLVEQQLAQPDRQAVPEGFDLYGGSLEELTEIGKRIEATRGKVEAERFMETVLWLRRQAGSDAGVDAGGESR